MKRIEKKRKITEVRECEERKRGENVGEKERKEIYTHPLKKT